jgi:hypothetical protein
MGPYPEKLTFSRRKFGMYRTMKIILTATLIVVTSLVKAQNTGITESELVKYAIATDSLKKLTDQYKYTSLKIANDPKISPVRQQQLAQTQGDSLKLVQAKATAYEKAYLKRVRDARNLETSNFRNAYSSLVNDYVGSDTFSKVMTRLKTDPQLRHKFDSITNTLQRKKP